MILNPSFRSWKFKFFIIRGKRTYKKLYRESPAYLS